jgi:uncharacterized membrane protein YfcA
MSRGVLGLLAALGAVAIAFLWRWYALERPRQPGRTCRDLRPRPVDLLIGFATNFFDALGIGNFAPTTAVFKLLKRMPDEDIPGTLNAGHSPPVLLEAAIFIGVVSVDLTTLVTMIGASVLGAWLGAGVVARLPRRAIQIGMGLALSVAALLFVAKNLGWIPGGGEALGLSGPWLLLAVGINFVLGALMMLGVGLYAPCLITVSLLGMNPLAAFPIMMGACAFLMPVGGARFIRERRYNLPASLGLTLGGIPGVLIAVFIVKSLPLTWLRWLVVVVVLYAAGLMLLSARRADSHEAYRSTIISNPP